MVARFDFFFLHRNESVGRVELSRSRVVACVHEGERRTIWDMIEQSIRWVAAIRSFARKWADRELSPPVITFWFRSNGANSPFPTQAANYFRSMAAIRLSFVSQKREVEVKCESARLRRQVRNGKCLSILYRQDHVAALS